MTGQTISRYRIECVDHPPFKRRLAASPLHLIELIVFIVIVSSAVTAQKAVPEKPALEVAITSITRQSDFFQIHYALKNKGSVDLYLPYHLIAGSIALTTYQLLQQTRDGDWVDIGPFYDIGADKAQIIHPDGALSLVEGTSAGAAHGAPKVCGDLKGCYKIRIGYYSGAAAWRQCMNAVKELQENRKVEMPKVEFADSDQFQLPPAAR